MVEVNGSEDCNLFIFANPIATDKPSESDPSVLYYEAGTDTNIGTLSLQSGQTLYIEGGAIVRGRLTCSNGTSDIAVKGYGILDSRGVDGRGIQFHKVTNVDIDGVTLINDINWSTFIAEGTGVDINNYKVVAVNNPLHDTGCENDALDLLGCKNARVTGCFGYAHDDVFCIKSHKWTYRGEVDDVVFEDCIAWNYLSGNSLVVGAETGCDVSNVTYRNCVSIHSAGRSSTLNRGGLSVHHCARGNISNILFENIVLEDCKEYGIHLDIRESYVNNLGNAVTDEEKAEANADGTLNYSPGTCNGITLRNVRLLNEPPRGNFAFGYDESHQIENIVFDNVSIAGKVLTEENIQTYFNPSMTYSRNGKTYRNLTFVSYTFE